MVCKDILGNISIIKIPFLIQFAHTFCGFEWKGNLNVNDKKSLIEREYVVFWSHSVAVITQDFES